MEALLQDIADSEYIGPQVIFATSTGTVESGLLDFDEVRAEIFLNMYFTACLDRREFPTDHGDFGRMLWLADITDQLSFRYQNQGLELSEERKTNLLEAFRKYMGKYVAERNPCVPDAVEVVKDNLNEIVDPNTTGEPETN